MDGENVHGGGQHSEVGRAPADGGGAERKADDLGDSVRPERTSSEPTRAEVKADLASRDADAIARAEPRDSTPETRGELPGADRFEGVGNRVAETVTADRWSEADRTGREAIAHEVNDLVRDEYGLPPQEARIESLADDLGPGTLGAYDPQDRSVRIDESLLEHDRPDELISTIAHENRHDVQQRIMDGDMQHPHGDFGRRETEIWSGAARDYGSSGLFADYAYNALETDARAAGSGVANGWLGAELDRARGEEGRL